MIDFHTHILPGMDDGSHSVEESIAMLQTQQEAEIERVVFTPHFYASKESPKDFLLRRNESWKSLLPHMYRGLPKVSFGAEVQYFEGICQVDTISSLRILGTPYLLLEMPFRRWDERMLDDVLELNSLPDTHVVLAHVDRYFSDVSPKTFTMLHNNGIKMQLNISAFENRKSSKTAVSMLKSGEVHVLGTDCHGIEHRQPNWEYLPDKAQELLLRSEQFAEIYNVLQNISF